MSVEEGNKTKYIKNMTSDRVNNQYNYFNLKAITSDLKLEFESLKELIRYFESQNIKTIYRIRSSEKDVEGFGIPSKGGFYFHASMGFRSLEDYKASLNGRFPDSETFYLSKDAGYNLFEDYTLACTSGIAEKTDFDSLVTGGYREGFIQFEAESKNQTWKWIPEGIGNPAQLYEHARKMGFSNFKSMATAFSLGFKNIVDYDIAIEKGFANAEDFAEGQQKGFHSGGDLNFARKYNLRDMADAQKYINLEQAGDEDLKHDARVFLILLSKLPQGKKVSVNKLKDLFQKAMDEFKYEDTNAFPHWFTFQFGENYKDLIDFLKRDSVKKYGLYDGDGEFLETVLLQKRKVVIDGSNVAYSTKKGVEKKPMIANMILVVEALIKKGIQEITIIADSSLKHRLIDKDDLPKLEALCTYLEAPAEKSADVFIIQMVKREHCLLLSNDTFREWKVQDPWIAENIDYYRVAFMIQDNQVLLPDFDI